MEEREKKKEDVCIKIVFWSFLSQLLFSISRRLFSALPYSSVVCAIASFIVLALLFIQLLSIKKNSINGKYILSIVIVTILYAISLISGTPFEKIILYYPLTVYGLTLLFVILSIKNYEKLYNYFLKNSFILSIISILILFVDRGTYMYNMHFSYILLIALCFHTLNCLYNKKRFDFFYILLDIVLILFYGSRGPILCYGFFLIACILFGTQKKLIKGILSVIVAVASVYVEKILSIMNRVIGMLGLHSRTLNLLVSDPQYTSGREVILQDSMNLLKNNPLIGYGLAGEYKYIADYPHNLLVDVVLHWGILFGGLFLIMIFHFIVKALSYSYKEIRLLLLVFISYGLITLFFSGTYLSWDGFYILLGLSFGIIKSKDRLTDEKQ